MSDRAIGMGEINLVPMNKIHADWKWNCRNGEMTAFDVDDMIQSIKERGLLQPVIITPYPAWKENTGGYEYLLIMGYRRYKAHECLGYDSIRAIVQVGLETEQDCLLVNMVENITRKDLTFRQQVDSVRRLLHLNMSLNEICQKLNVTYGWGQQRFYAAKLPNVVTEEIMRGTVNITSTRKLFSIYKAAKDREGTDAAVDLLMDALKTLKTAKINSKRDPLKKLENQQITNKRRSTKEIETMQDRILDLVGPCLATRVMAWIAGVISTDELELDLQRECEVLQCTYIKPTA